jgi:hypothetical protein
MIRIKIKYILWFLVSFGGYYLCKNIKLVETPIKQKLIEKVVTSDRYGKAIYNYKWLLPDGSIRTERIDFEYSDNYKINKTYIFNNQTFEFK